MTRLKDVAQWPAGTGSAAAAAAAATGESPSGSGDRPDLHPDLVDCRSASVPTWGAPWSSCNLWGISCFLFILFQEPACLRQHVKLFTAGMHTKACVHSPSMPGKACRCNGECALQVLLLPQLLPATQVRQLPCCPDAHGDPCGNVTDRLHSAQSQ